MASLASLAEFRASQPALASLPDAQIQASLDAVSAWARGITGPITSDDFTANGVTVKLRKARLIDGAILLPTKFATEVVKFEGAAYSGVSGTDYWLMDEELTLKTYPAFLTDAPFFTLTVKGGVAVPADLKNAIIHLSAQELTKDGGRIVGSQSLGPRSVTYSATGESEESLRSAQVVKSYAPIQL